MWRQKQNICIFSARDLCAEMRSSVLLAALALASGTQADKRVKKIIAVRQGGWR